MLRDLYDRMGKVEPAVQKVQTQVAGIRSTVETVLTPAGDEIPMQQNLPDTTKVGRSTDASMAIPSSYFLNLKSIYTSAYVITITASWLTVHDNTSPWKTIALSTISETNDISIAGPVAGGRDQAGTFTPSTWIYFFVIYNPTTRDVSSLSSASPTAPTLPTGYTYFIKTTSTHLTSNTPPQIASTHWQVGPKHYTSAHVKFNQNPSVVDVLEVVDLSNFVPTTAVSIFGFCGNSSTLGTEQNMRVSSTTGGLHTYRFTMGTRTAPGTNYSVAHGMFFELPIRIAQQMAWAVSSTLPKFAIIMVGYEDDI